MDKLAFAPFVDFPLAAVTVGAFIWHFNRWSMRRDIETSIDIASRLPNARLRVIILFAGALLLCWFLNIAFWSIIAFLLGVGLAVAVIFCGDIDGGAFGLWATAFVIREWAFGFPQLILHPQRRTAPSSTRRESPSVLLGKVGVTTSPLRPMGEVDIEGTKHSVVTFDGGLLDTDTEVTVTSYRNGYPCVTPIRKAE